MYCDSCEAAINGQQLKLDTIAFWIERNWKPQHPETAWVTITESATCVNHATLARFDRDKALGEGFTFSGYERVPNDIIPFVAQEAQGKLRGQSGVFRYQFTAGETCVEVLVTAAFYADGTEYLLSLVCLPETFVPVWSKFMEDMHRLEASLQPKPEVTIIGGRAGSFEPTVEWEDIILPTGLKHDLLMDVESFFTKGTEVYKRFKLKPFRKLLLAGIPGTGKTMICSALAKWAIERQYVTIYVSSANGGAHFGKLQQALTVAANSEQPALILLEEFDSYLNINEKALVLNVLDGVESALNDRGTLLVATTNYPEVIDERILKRPGRLDRIFVIPETRTSESAEKMLQHYLGEMWIDEHRAVAQRLVGYPGAFIREVAIYALTQAAYSDIKDLPLALLERSYDRLREQINARDDFLTRRGELGFAKATA